MKNFHRNIQDAVKWYKESGFNFLIDYYPDYECIPYGSGVTRKNIETVIAEVRPSAIIVFAKGHSGYTSYKSSLGCAHPRLAKDILKMYREITYKHNVRMFTYISGLLNELAVKHHPEWAAVVENRGEASYQGMTNLDAKKSSVSCICPSGGYFEGYMSVLIEEIISGYSPDGIWFDGDWGGAFCYCERCHKLFEKAAGRKFSRLPDLNDVESESGVLWHEWMLKLNNDWQRKCSDLIHKLSPGCLYSSGNVTLPYGMNDYMDYHSGDFFSPNAHRIRISTAMKYLASKERPFEAMVCDCQFCKGTPQAFRSRAKSVERMLQEGATVISNGGQWVYWTIPRADGAIMKSRIDNAKTARDFFNLRKDILIDTESAAECAVVTRKQHSKLTWAKCDSTIAASVSSLIKLHKSPDLLDFGYLKEASRYKLLVLNDEPLLSAGDVKLLEDMVKQGTNILACGSTIKSDGIADLLGVKLVQENALPEGHVFSRKTGLPAGFNTRWHYVERNGASTGYKLFKSWDCGMAGFENIPVNYPLVGIVDEENPDYSGYPAVTVRRIGKGKVFYMACNPFEELHNFGHPGILNWLRELFDRIDAAPLIKTDMPSWCELVVRKNYKSGNILINIINGNSGKDMSKVNNCDLYADEIPVIGPFSVFFRKDFNIGRILWNPGGIKMEFKDSGDYHEIKIPRFHIHGWIEICPSRSHENHFKKGV